MKRTARISEDGLYRYWLAREWGAGGRFATWIMLNPSTADALVDDPTIRRCIGFSKREQCDGLIVVNLYAYRATKPVDLVSVDDPVGPENVAVIRETLRLAADDGGPVVAAWGSWWGQRSRRVKGPGFPRIGVETLADAYGVDLHCLGKTSSGAPRHPLYVKGDAPLVPYMKES